MARAAVATGVDGLFFEIHDRPETALSDGANALSLEELPTILGVLKQIDRVVKSR